MSGSTFILSVKVMEQQGADEKLLECSSNVNADIGFESLLKADVSRRLEKLDMGDKLELGMKTRQCKYRQRVAI